MKLYQQAEALLDKPVTLDSMHEWERLCKQARGKEADQIGEMYETLLDELPEDLFNAYMEELADWSEAQD